MTRFASNSGHELVRIESFPSGRTHAVAGEASFDFGPAHGTRHGLFEIVRREQRARWCEVDVSQRAEIGDPAFEIISVPQKKIRLTNFSRAKRPQQRLGKRALAVRYRELWFAAIRLDFVNVLAIPKNQFGVCVKDFCIRRMDERASHGRDFLSRGFLGVAFRAGGGACKFIPSILRPSRPPAAFGHSIICGGLRPLPNVRARRCKKQKYQRDRCSNDTLTGPIHSNHRGCSGAVALSAPTRAGARPSALWEPLYA